MRIAQGIFFTPGIVYGRLEGKFIFRGVWGFLSGREWLLERYSQLPECVKCNCGYLSLFDTTHLHYAKITSSGFLLEIKCSQVY